MDDNGQQVDCTFAFTSPLPDSPQKVRHYYASSIVLSNQTQRSCSTSPTSPSLLSPSRNSSPSASPPSPSPSASPNSFATTLSLNFPSTRTTTSSYSTKHPYPPSVNIAELCRSAVNANGSNSPTSASAAFLSSDSDGLAAELLWEALDPQLWSSTQLLSSNFASESAAIKNTIAMSVAVTHALRQIPANSIISSTPCSSSPVSFPNCTSSASPSASTISQATTSYSSTPQLPLCILLTGASLSAVLASPLSSMPSSCVAKDANSVLFLHNREVAADFLRDVPDPTPTPKRKWQSTSRTNTRSPVAMTQQLQARSIKPVKFNKSLVTTQAAAASVIITPSKTDNLAMHLLVPLQTRKCAAPVPFIDAGNQTGNPGGGGTWLSMQMKLPVTGELPLA